MWRALSLVLVLSLASCGGDGAPASSGTAESSGAAGKAESSGTQGAAEKSRSEPARDVVLISVDTLRHDALGYAGASTSTPAIDRLAARGRTFSRARAHTVMTTPSHFSMLTGLEPYQHGVRDNGGFALGEGIPTLASFLAGAGFATGGFVGAYPLASEKGFARGFEVYDDVHIDAELNEDLLLGLPNPRAGVGQRSGREVVTAALEWWQKSAARRRFLFVHVYEPHAPYDPPSPFRERYADPYQGEVAWTDHLLAPLLEQLERDTGVLVVFTSDHGEAFGEHGEPTHGFFAYEGTLRVPLVLAGPGVVPGDDARNVRHIDLVPTLLEGLGFQQTSFQQTSFQQTSFQQTSLEQTSFEKPGAAVGPAKLVLHGRSLLDPAASWSGETTYFESLSPFFNFGWAPLRGLVDGRYKLIEQPLPELYDLAADPSETHNLIDQQRATARRLLAGLPDSRGFGVESRSLDDEERSRLAALGYLDARQARGQSVADFAPSDDLKNVIGPYNRLRDVVAWLHDGRDDEVVKAARELEPQVPGSPLLYSCWTAALIKRGDALEAVGVIRRAMAREAATADLRRQLGISLMRLGRASEAVAVLRAEADRLPSDMTLNVLGHALVQSGDPASAQQVFEKAAAKFPKSPRALENLSFLRLQLGDAAGAESFARRALELREDLPGALNNLGLALVEQGRAREGIEAWDRALKLAPDNVDVLFNHGLVSVELGESDSARRSLRRFLELMGGHGDDPREDPSEDPRVAEARRLMRQLGG